MWSTANLVRSVPFGILTSSLLSSKLLLIRTHYSSIPTVPFVFYLPTLLVHDFVIITIARLLLSVQRLRFLLPGLILVSLASLFTLGGVASQLGFYVKTGSDIDFRGGSKWLGDKDGLAVLLSGLYPVLVSGCLLLICGACLGNPLFHAYGQLLEVVYEDCKISIGKVRSRLFGQPQRLASSTLEYRSKEAYGSDLLDPESQCEKSSYEENLPRLQDATPGATRWLLKAASLTYILVTIVHRPVRPYTRLSASLPITLLGLFETSDPYATRASLLANPFPIISQLSSTTWHAPYGKYFKGWAPSVSDHPSDLAEIYRDRQSDWWPKSNVPNGFYRWESAAPERAAASPFGDDQASSNMARPDVYYNPVSDPLKITNLDLDILQSLRGALSHGSVKIKHVALVIMESARIDLWPMQGGGHFYETIMGDTSDALRTVVDERLSRLTPNSERITGLNYDRVARSDEFGGLNVIGGYTAATYSTKSYAALQCGIPPMTSDGFPEIDYDPYQPCLPQIFDMFNAANGERSVDDWRNRPWKTAMFQSTSEQYDRVDEFDAKMGFHKTWGRQEIEWLDRFNATDPLYQTINAFAYPEPVILPELNAFIDETLANDERLYLTHVTSSTHHRFDVPSDYPVEDYMPRMGSWSATNDLNKWLQTVKYHDEWLGTFLDVIEEKGIAEETLVVFVGDHGLSMAEDCGIEGAYDNNHVSNFRVGLTFRHPHLPQTQHHANITTLSVLPTILDLLISSGSLNDREQHIASDLVFDYEGQSLIRPYKEKDGERRAWSFSAMNPGGKRLGITSADVPWRMVLPLIADAQYYLTNPVEDAMENDPVTAWLPEDFVKAVRDKMGNDAALWATEAVAIGNWWKLEKQRLWKARTIT